ncbi:MAG: peptidylprolyl isomerase [Nocardioidaceae bacterium]|nr:peptidylprolyl isomerase [Nocardioidaceae bacterium]
MRALRWSVPLLASLLLLAGCGGGSDDSAGSSATGSSPKANGTTTASGTCSYPPAGQAAKPVKPPPAKPAGKARLTMRTNRGDLPLTLRVGATPCTVNSFTSLAAQGYFDKTRCHRLTTQGIFVLQCGDPTGQGTGGPGYQFDDELDGQESYPAGTLAMANAGPNTNGSQFFIVYRDSPLPPAYTVFGSVSPAGLKLVQGIARQGTSDGSPDGPPKQPVVITSVR